MAFQGGRLAVKLRGVYHLYLHNYAPGHHHCGQRTTKGHFTGAEMRPKYKATWIDFAAAAWVLAKGRGRESRSKNEACCWG